MPETWTAEVKGRMHMHRITGRALAEECGWSENYVSQILNSHVSSDGTRMHVLQALARLEERRAASGEEDS